MPLSDRYCTTLRNNATRGAALLDEKLPGWWRTIDLSTLDLGDPDRCIVGQFMAWGLGSGLRGGMYDHRYGFDKPDYMNGKAPYRALDAIWTELIKERWANAPLDDVPLEEVSS